MSKALIAAAPTNPGIFHYPIHSSETLEEPTVSYPENHGEDSVFAFSEHWLTRYYQQSLWQQHPLLFLLLVYYAQQQAWSDEQWLQCRRQSLQNLLAAIDLPATEANYRVLMDATETDELDQLLSYRPSELAMLYQFFKSDSASSLAKAALHQTITHMLQRYFISEAHGPF
ncbi:hypothetical protein [Methylobacter sp. YRD-M1]|uniref:hypothetical protein n=1 Tax=Methylobacter sp. YRD-M1 TaxID=2911520 RepID=UPI00227B6721|nr:hypothetical protein [Methylobacter sp. YRD-M1]WAK02141.1 hypothetical protein LZ558_20390 [Methylobacter sp. YRD-M1]